MCVPPSCLAKSGFYVNVGLVGGAGPVCRFVKHLSSSFLNVTCVLVGSACHCLVDRPKEKKNRERLRPAKPALLVDIAIHRSTCNSNLPTKNDTKTTEKFDGGPSEYHRRSDLHCIGNPPPLSALRLHAFTRSTSKLNLHAREQQQECWRWTLRQEGEKGSYEASHQGEREGTLRNKIRSVLSL